MIHGTVLYVCTYVENVKCICSAKDASLKQIVFNVILEGKKPPCIFMQKAFRAANCSERTFF